jgi:hypothetical protein
MITITNTIIIAIITIIAVAIITIRSEYTHICTQLV